MRKVKAYGEILEIPEHRVFWLSKLVYSTPFEITIAFVILLNAISLGLLTMPGLSESSAGPRPSATPPFTATRDSASAGSCLFPTISRDCQRKRSS